VITPSLLDRG